MEMASFPLLHTASSTAGALVCRHELVLKVRRYGVTELGMRSLEIVKFSCSIVPRAVGYWRNMILPCLCICPPLRFTLKISYSLILVRSSANPNLKIQHTVEELPWFKIVSKQPT